MSRASRSRNDRQAREGAAKNVPASPARRIRWGRALALALAAYLIGAAVYVLSPPRIPARTGGDVAVAPAEPEETRDTRYGNLTLHWDPPGEEAEAEFTAEMLESNIHRGDYAGPESCRTCHAENYADWAQHPHRFMNALATEDRVVGDFSGTASITYQGARGEFYREGEQFRMQIKRGEETFVYRINQTIGSRFFQYYIGQGIAGQPPRGHFYYHQDHVLPFGYWIDRQMWVPIVHVTTEFPDEGERWNPLDPPMKGDPGGLVYERGCNGCHTTLPLAEHAIRQPWLVGDHVPARMTLFVSRYLKDERPEVWSGTSQAGEASYQSLYDAIEEEMTALPAEKSAAGMGVSCEACHLGCRAHAAGEQLKPAFLPRSAHLALSEESEPAASGRTAANINWICSRCHSGDRPRFRAGMATWNSTEFSDAQLGACYPQLTCIHCHDPHKAIGPRWTRPPQEDDAVCVSCHQQYEDAGRRRAHTGHPAGTSGDRCLNCHMPRINEGLQDVVRTHTIFSPTNQVMIEANQPNACNLCHLDKPIDWTLEHLEKWYGRRYAPTEIEWNYPTRDQPVGLGWLAHENEAVRLVATDVLCKSNATWALPQLLAILDDDYLLNRQFAQQGIEDMLGIELLDYGYRFYMTRAERSAPLAKLRRALLHPPQQAAVGRRPAPGPDP